MHSKKTIVLAGGTGLIGKKLINLLHSEYDVILITRDINKTLKSSKILRSIPWSDREKLQEAVEKSFAVINLAGAPIVGKRWTQEYKQILLQSRLEPTKILVSAIKHAKTPPSVLINASAIGYYGTDHPDMIRNETSPSGNDFLAHLCEMWEKEAEKATTYGTRVVRIRSGIVLDTAEGALAQMIIPFRFGLGGPIGFTPFYLPWIHIDDEAGIIRYALEHSQCTGAINAVATECISNKTFAFLIGKVLHRPSLFPIPSFILSLLFGEGAQVITKGVKVSSQKIRDLGYTFSYPYIEDALSNLLS